MVNFNVSLAVLLARHDAEHDNWATVEWSRAMRGMARDLGIASALSDVQGRPVVDELPLSCRGADASFDFEVDTYEADPITERTPSLRFRVAA